ncbi:MAG: hypothetical protein WCK89_10820 [bacterium]
MGNIAKITRLGGAEVNVCTVSSFMSQEAAQPGHVRQQKGDDAAQDHGLAEPAVALDEPDDGRGQFPSSVQAIFRNRKIGGFSAVIDSAASRVYIQGVPSLCSLKSLCVKGAPP